MANVVPVQALVVGVVALAVGFFWVPYLRASFEKTQGKIAKSTERYERAGRMKAMTKASRQVAPLMTQANNAIATAFGWLCLGVGALAILCYVVGFFGINLAEVLLNSGTH